MEEVTEAIDRGEEEDVLYLEFAKAFDKVPHKRLLSKLNGYGIKGQIYDITENSGWLLMENFHIGYMSQVGFLKVS